MADEADLAADAEELERRHHLYALAKRVAATPKLHPTGACHWCGQRTPSVFCSPECRDDFDLDADSRRRSGRG